MKTFDRELAVAQFSLAKETAVEKTIAISESGETVNFAGGNGAEVLCMFTGIETGKTVSILIGMGTTPTLAGGTAIARTILPANNGKYVPIPLPSNFAGETVYIHVTNNNATDAVVGNIYMAPRSIN